MDRRKNKRNSTIISSTQENKNWAQKEIEKKKTEETNNKIKTFFAENKEEIKNEIQRHNISLDISTSVIGITVLNTEGKICVFDSINLTKDKSNIDLYDKVEAFILAFEKIIYSLTTLGFYSIKNIFVEESMKAFSMGFSSANTIITLAKFNAMICYSLYKLTNKKPIEINVRTARAKLGIKINTKEKEKVKGKTTKDLVREKAIELYPELKEKLTYHIVKSGKNKGQTVLDKENADKIDSYILCRAAQILYK